jgi:hypothetical protein
VLIREPEPPVVVREREYSKPPHVISRERDLPKPPPAVVRERDLPKPPPVAVRENEPARPPVRPAVPPVAERAPRSVEVILLSGEMKVRGQRQQLERVALRMAEGESRDLTLKVGGETRTLSLYYGNGELSIDGTPGKGRDAIHLSYEKEWRSGKVYRLNLKGRVQVEKLELKVTGAGN